MKLVAQLICNGLPHNVTSAPKLQIFCSRLNTHLFSHCFQNFLQSLWSELCYYLTLYSVTYLLTEMNIWW